jgi:hypothetical protein
MTLAVTENLAMTFIIFWKVPEHRANKYTSAHRQVRKSNGAAKETTLRATLQAPQPGESQECM